MDNKFIEKQMLDLKEQIKVNNDLKRNLRSSFDKKTARKWKLPVAVAVVAVICVVMVSYLGSPRVYVNHVNAASIKILNQVSFADIGEASGDAAEYNGTVYSAVFGQGIYAYNSNGYREIYKGDVNALNVSADGKKLVFSDGNLNIFDIETSKATVLLKGDESTYYEQPAWASDSKHIIYVKKVIEPLETHGFEETESSICQIDIETMDVKKLADGNSPSYAGKENIVFERDGNIIRKNIKDQSEKIIDTGRFPSVSPDGGYVAYVKTEKREKAISAKLSVEENIDNVWIADVNFETKKQLTMNFAEDEEMSEDEIAENTSDLPMSILKNGVYSYYNPKWSSDSKNLYVLKNNNKTRNMKLMRISFTDSELTAEDTVANYIQALISRDDDYAKSLMHNPPDLITVSNPRIVGYKILNSGSENGKQFVEAETYWSYTAQPDFQVLKQNYYLSPLNSGYIIDEITTVDELAIGLSKDGQSLIMKKEKDQILFNISDIPKGYLSEGNSRIASLSFSEEDNSVIFSVQVLEDGVQKSSVKVLAYDISNKEFKFIDHIKNINGKENVVIESLISDSEGRYAAVKLFSSDDPDFKTTVLVYDLKDNKKADIRSLLRDIDVGGIHTKFWDRNVLVLELTGEGQTMSFLYNPESGELKSFGEN